MARVQEFVNKFPNQVNLTGQADQNGRPLEREQNDPITRADSKRILK